MPTDDLPHLTPAERERWRVAHAASAGTWVKTEMTNDYDGIWEEDVWDINAIDGDCTTLIADMGKRGIEVVTANADHVILNQPATVIATLRRCHGCGMPMRLRAHNKCFLCRAKADRDAQSRPCFGCGIAVLDGHTACRNCRRDRKPCDGCDRWTANTGGLCNQCLQTEGAAK